MGYAALREAHFGRAQPGPGQGPEHDPRVPMVQLRVLNPERLRVIVFGRSPTQMNHTVCFAQDSARLREVDLCLALVWRCETIVHTTWQAIRFDYLHSANIGYRVCFDVRMQPGVHCMSFPFARRIQLLPGFPAFLHFAYHFAK